MKISMIQLNSRPDRAYNLAEARRLMLKAVQKEKPDLIVLPEHFDWTGGTVAEKTAAADLVPGGRAHQMIQRFAAEHGVAIHAGSILESVPGHDRIFNTSVIFDANGSQIGTYRKLHLFDIIAPDGKRYAESETVAPGNQLLIYELRGFRIACCICYDLRFSRLFDRLAAEKADVFILPAAFTTQTGKFHWEVLCRARAIEFQAFMVACGQCGSYTTPAGEERHMFGNSMICDPWGQILVRAQDTPGVFSARIDPDRLRQVRSWIPMEAHRLDLDVLPVATAKASPKRELSVATQDKS